MDHQEPTIYVARWWRRPDGLIVPSTLADRVQEDLPPDLPTELRPNPPAVGFHVPVDATAQIHAFIDEALLGEPISTLERVRMMVREVGFEPAMEALSILAARVRAAGRSAEAQERLAQFIYGNSALLEKIKIHLNDERGLHVCAEQHVYALMRIVIAEAPQRTISAPRTQREGALLARALLGMSSVVGQIMEDALAGFTEGEEWLPHLIQLGFFYDSPQPLVELARTEVMLQTAASEGAADLESYCPIHDWYREHLGLTAEEQTRLMMAMGATANAFDPAETKTHVTPEGLDNILLTADLIEKRETALSLISASREEFLAMFQQLDEDQAGLIWELRPFKSRPFLRCEDGGLVLLSPRFLQSWMTEGFHYRALDVAAGIGPAEGNRYTAYAGRLYEQTCLDLMKEAQRDVSGVEVYGGTPYQRGPSGETADVAVDYVLDLVLFEVTNSRPRAATLISGNRDDALDDLERVLIKKCRQLDACINRILAGDAAFPADLSQLRNVWPVVVSAGVPLQMPPLWNHLLEKLPNAFQQARVRPLTLLDPEDYELLCGLVEGGAPLPDILARKTLEPYRYLDFKAWFNDDPQAPRPERRPRLLEEAFKIASQRVIDGMDFTRVESSGI